MAKLHYRIDNIRKDFLHQLSHQITAEFAEVKVETLSIRGWKKLHGRKTNDLAPAEFLRQLGYKTDWRGGRLSAADMWFPSSRLCHDCGWKYENLTLLERTWTCQRCGAIHDRDANAALNIRDYGPELPGDCLWTPCKTTVPVAAAVDGGDTMRERVGDGKSVQGMAPPFWKVSGKPRSAFWPGDLPPSRTRPSTGLQTA